LVESFTAIFPDPGLTLTVDVELKEYPNVAPPKLPANPLDPV
jgi:hypothetical protein